MLQTLQLCGWAEMSELLLRTTNAFTKRIKLLVRNWGKLFSHNKYDIFMGAIVSRG